MGAFCSYVTLLLLLAGAIGSILAMIDDPAHDLKHRVQAVSEKHGLKTAVGGLAIITAIVVLIDVLHLLLLALHFSGAALLAIAGVVAVLGVWRVGRLVAAAHHVWISARSGERRRSSAFAPG